jgi:hypothetical protein
MKHACAYATAIRTEGLATADLCRGAETHRLNRGWQELFAHALADATALEARARGKPPAAAGAAPTLTLTQVYSLAREHSLLCAPLNNLQALRRWLLELRDFKPSRASRTTLPISPASAGGGAAGGTAFGAHGGLSPPLHGQPSHAGAAPPRGESNAARVDEFVFCRLMNDLDPIARLRDAAFELSMHVSQLALRLPAPRHSARHAAEARAVRWEHLGSLVVRSLDSLHAHLRGHTIGYVRQGLGALLPLPPPPFAPRARPPPPAMPPPRPPIYDVDRATPIPHAAEAPRVVYSASERSGGGGVGCIGVLPQRSLVPQKLGGRPLVEHLALEV